MDRLYRHALTKIAIGLGAFALFATLSPSHAAPPLDDYLSARDAYVAKFDPATRKSTTRRSKTSRRRHGRSRKEIAGACRAGRDRGCGSAKSNLGSLIKGDMDLASSTRSSLRNAAARRRPSSDARPHRQMAVEHKGTGGDKDTPNVPQKTADALAFDGFYTQALKRRRGSIEIRRPSRDEARGRGRRDGHASTWCSQDVGVGRPDEIIVALVRGERVFRLVAGSGQGWPSGLRRGVEGHREKAARADGDTARNSRGRGPAAYRTCYVES